MPNFSPLFSFSTFWHQPPTINVSQHCYRHACFLMFDSYSITNTTTPTPEQGICFLSAPSIEDEDESSPPSTPHASLVSTFSPEADIIPSPTSGPCPPTPRKTSSLFSSDRDEAGLSVSLVSLCPFKINNVDPDPPPIHTIVTAGLHTLCSYHIIFSSPCRLHGYYYVAPLYQYHYSQEKEGCAWVMTDLINKWPEITTLYDPVHLTHVNFDLSTREFTGLPKEWQQFLKESEISKSNQEEIVEFYQESGGDVWDKMGHALTPGALNHHLSQAWHIPKCLSLWMIALSLQ